MVMTKGAITPELYVSVANFEMKISLDDPLTVTLKQKQGKGSLRVVCAAAVELLLTVRPRSLCLNWDFLEFPALTHHGVLAVGVGIGT
jgi:hypothetical protein